MTSHITKPRFRENPDDGEMPAGAGDAHLKRTRSRGRKNIIFRVYPEEHADFSQRAAGAGLSLSELIRRVVEGHVTHSRYDYDVLEKLAAVHTDMNRLGNLFRMALGQKDATGEPAYAGYEPNPKRRISKNTVEPKAFFITPEKKQPQPFRKRKRGVKRIRRSPPPALVNITARDLQNARLIAGKYPISPAGEHCFTGQERIFSETAAATCP